jgi:hypothetical protein
MERHGTVEERRFFAKTFADAFERVFGGEEEVTVCAHGEADEGKQALIDELVATEHFDEDDATWLEDMTEDQLEFLVASCCERAEDYRMPGIPIGKTVRASEMAVEEPRRLPSGHYAMPGIRVGRAMSASEKQEPRSFIVDNGTLPNGVHRMPGIRIGGNR